MGAHPQSRLAHTLRRVLAAGGAALVFVLCLFAASPVLHQRLHHGTTGMFDDGCAVVLFANGVAAPVALAAPLPPVEKAQPVPLVAPDVMVDSPRYLLLPGRGPPAA